MLSHHTYKITLADLKEKQCRGNTLYTDNLSSMDHNRGQVCNSLSYKYRFDTKQRVLKEEMLTVDELSCHFL